jgi:hypothetical protein
MRVKNKNAPYVHEPRPEIEKFANQTEWEPDTLVDVEPTVRMEQQGPSTSAPPTTTPQNPQGKEAPTGIISSCNRGVIGGISNALQKAEDSFNDRHDSRSKRSLTTTVTTTGAKQFTSTFRLESA